MTVRINLEKTFNQRLGLKITARELFNILENETEATLDFKGVTFISRDFAQEYILQKRNSNVKITEINMYSIVRDILKKVETEYPE